MELRFKCADCDRGFFQFTGMTDVIVTRCWFCGGKNVLRIRAKQGPS